VRVQLRPFYSSDELRRVYAHPYDHTRWEDHRTRVALTTQFARWYADSYRVRSIADLTCGDGAIARNVAAGTERLLTLSDMVHADHLDMIGPIEETLPLLDPVGVDMFICTETLEHVERPDELLAEIRKRAKILILSTPDGETNDANPEHYWGWDVPEIEGMLHNAGWKADRLLMYDTQLVYNFQIWGCL